MYRIKVVEGKPARMYEDQAYIRARTPEQAARRALCGNSRSKKITVNQTGAYLYEVLESAGMMQYRVIGRVTVTPVNAQGFLA